MKEKKTGRKYNWLPAVFLIVAGVCCCLRMKAYVAESVGELSEVEWPFLQEGDYTIYVEYEGADGTGNVTAASDTLVDPFNKQGVVLASEDITGSSGILNMRFHLDQPTWSVVLAPGGEQETPILRHVKLQSVGLQDRDNYFVGGGLILLGILVFFFGHAFCSPRYRVLMILLLIGIGASLPLMNGVLKWGLDIRFHLARLEGIYQGLRSGYFPVRINPVQSAGFGYLSSAMYPQLFLYPFAALRFFGISLMLCYKLLIFSINIGTAFLSYYGVKCIARSEKIGILAAILYTFSAFRLNGLYMDATLGETIAMAFWPLAACGVYEIFWGDPKKWYLLTLGMSGILESHVLSTGLALNFAAAAALVWVFRGNRSGWLGRIGHGMLSAVMTLLWNVWTWVPIIFYSGEGLAVYEQQNTVSRTALHPSQLFTLFMEPQGSDLTVNSLRGEMPLSAGGYYWLAV